MERNLCKKVLCNGGDLYPLIIPNKDSFGLGLMNPSIFIYKNKPIVNIRHINYTLWHSENEQMFNNKWGPLAYLHPENDQHLKTENFIAYLTDDFEINEYHKVDMTLNVPNPLWEFHGLEDARLVEWDNKLYMSGVRRDTTPNGEGRIELSEIEITNDTVKEVSRLRTIPPGKPTYCEKNWMPILDMPYHYIKWCNPTQVVRVDPISGQAETVFVSKNYIPNIRDFRGGSQVINWMGLKMALIHEVDLYKNYIGQKDADYYHRIVLWDNMWNIVDMSEQFSFMTGKVEFAAGMAFYQGNLLITFGFQDNAAYLLKIPEDKISEIFGLKNYMLERGVFNNNSLTMNNIYREVVIDNRYQQLLNVNKDDIVVDIGASIGVFGHKIRDNNPKHVYSLEPHTGIFKSLEKNLNNKTVYTNINKGISNTNEHFIISDITDEYSDKNINVEGITFDIFLSEYNITKIDFLKINCEGGEYDVFNETNRNWILKNVKKIVGEFHIFNDDHCKKFNYFKEKYIPHFNKVIALTYNNVNITDILYEDNFNKKFTYFTLHIDNR